MDPRNDRTFLTQRLSQCKPDKSCKNIRACVGKQINKLIWQWQSSPLLLVWIRARAKQINRPFINKIILAICK